MQIFKTNSVKSAIIGIYTLLFFTFVIAGLYLGRVILMPLALAILLVFLFSPLVSKFEKVLGRILSVMLVVILITIATGFTGYVLSKEFIRFATDFPTYRTNIDAKIFSLKTYKEVFTTSTETISAIKSTFSNEKKSPQDNQNELIDFNKIFMTLFEEIFGSFISIVATTLLVLLFFVFILIDREDLRGRIIQLIGKGRIGSTTHAINDANKRVSRYLFMFLVLNIVYGLVVAIGLYILGIPNPLLWGAFSAILRFVPYVGVWIAAALPIGLSLAISASWLLPILTISLFVCLESACFNIFEPLLFGTSTGISSIALIISAIFWTLLWGPVGLILSAPLTVLLVVLGRHVPRLEFFSILLSTEQPLAFHEEYYHRLLISNINEIDQLTNTYLKDKSLLSLYDNVLIPVITIAEIDNRKEVLDDSQLYTLQQNLAEMIDELSTATPLIDTEGVPNQDKDDMQEKKVVSESVRTKEAIICLPVKAKRDELAGEMLTQLLRRRFFNAINVPSEFKFDEKLEFLKKNHPKIIIISVIPPSAIIQARHLVRKIRSQFPKTKIIVGLFGYSENLTEVTAGLKASGADITVTTLAEALSVITK